LQWRLAAALAEVLSDRRRRVEADAFALRARSLISTLAKALGDDEAAQAFTTRARAAVPDPGETPLRADRRRYGGLTRREREVAVLVATGRTNREIAEVLVLGERTVESHVASALHRLDFSSRAQLAGWAVEVGLVEAARAADSR
jgi:non-specific serine/threonine protein kinase